MPPPAPCVADAPDVLLEEIFLRLPAAADLARASAACTSFRSVIAGHAFLRRYRALHPPPLMGIVHNHIPFVPAQPPHPSTGAARAFVGFDFSCSSFLPSTPEHTWSPIDFFDGRVLLNGVHVEERSIGILFSRRRQIWDRDLAVCDPVHHRYVLLPAVPGDLKALAPQPDLLRLEAFLAPGQDEEDPLSFRVMCLVQCTTTLLLLVFSSSLGGQGQWHALTFDQWGSQAITCASDGFHVISSTGLSNRQFVRGCFYWHLRFRTELLVLDVRALEFTAVNLPSEQGFDRFKLFEAAEGMLGMLTKGYGHYSDGQHWLSYSILRNNQWQLEKVIQLPVKRVNLVGVAGGYNLVGVAGGYLLIEAWYATSSQETQFGYFSVDLTTFQVELFAKLSEPIFQGRPYASFPPSLCAPTI